MATALMSQVLQHLRRAVLLRDGAGLTDGQLLEEFVSRRDGAALAALVRRHGPMVWGVCRRLLRDHHEAEDAFQATFLVLVRKAATVVPRERVGNWLYGVARQTALKARATAARRRGRERPVTQMPEPAVAGPDLWDDLRPVLDQELSRLPEKYRAVLVLCDLEGQTRREAARQLGLAEGTVASRLARGRAMLARRLARHGLAVSGGSLGAVLSEKAASAGVPPLAVSCTVKTATLVAAGPAATAGVISPAVAALTEGVLRAMFLSQLKTAFVVLFLAGLLGTAGVVIRSTAAQEQPVAAQGEARAGQGKQSLQETILSLERKLAEAGDRQDVETLQRYTADDFLGVVKEGRYTKIDLLEGVRKFRFATLSMAEVRLVVLNRDAVVLSYKARTRRSSPTGQEVVLTTRYVSSTWVRRGSNWMYVFSDQVVIPDDAGADAVLPNTPLPLGPKPEANAVMPNTPLRLRPAAGAEAVMPNTPLRLGPTPVPLYNPNSYKPNSK